MNPYPTTNLKPHVFPAQATCVAPHLTIQPTNWPIGQEMWKLSFFASRKVASTIWNLLPCFEDSFLLENMCFFCGISYIHTLHIWSYPGKSHYTFCVPPSLLTILPPELLWHTGGYGASQDPWTRKYLAFSQNRQQFPRMISREEDIWLWKIGNDQPNIPYEEKLSDTLKQKPSIARLKLGPHLCQDVGVWQNNQLEFDICLTKQLHLNFKSMPNNFLFISTQF